MDLNAITNLRKSEQRPLGCDYEEEDQVVAKSEATAFAALDREHGENEVLGPSAAAQSIVMKVEADA